VMDEGTICPADILELMSSARSEPDFRSSRSKSPADRCVHDIRSERRVHCVPFPAPGPPRTKTTWNLALEEEVVHPISVFLALEEEEEGWWRSRYCVYAIDEEMNRNAEKGQIPKDDDLLVQEEHELPPPVAVIFAVCRLILALIRWMSDRNSFTKEVFSFAD